MPSSFSWLDYSDVERRRALEVISLFKQRETRDELGLGSIRDAFADMFAPGTSTVQTRARYFLLVPWIYQDLERRRVSSANVAGLARRDELRMIDPLARSADPDGTIGIDAGASLQRLPSNIYWAGLRRWGILLFEGGQHQYHQSLDRFHGRLSSHRSRASETAELTAPPVNWHPHIPAPPEGLPTGISLQLRAEEADFLRDRILGTASDSMLAHLVSLDAPWEQVRFPWHHPQFSEFPAHLVPKLNHARRFSEVMHGAALLYNLMLSTVAERGDLIDQYSGRFHAWAAGQDARGAELAEWQLNEFWSLFQGPTARIPSRTQRFVSGWVELVRQSGGAGSLDDAPAARRLIGDREARLKGGRARLRSRRHLELWRGASGTAQLSYRWGITQQIALDILRGLH